MVPACAIGRNGEELDTRSLAARDITDDIGNILKDARDIIDDVKRIQKDAKGMIDDVGNILRDVWGMIP